MKRTWNWTGGMLTVGLMVAAVDAWLHTPRDNASADDAASSSAATNTTHPATSASSIGHSVDDLYATHDLYGQIAQEPEHVTHITSTKPGVVESILVNVDQIVDPGTPLCILRTKDGQSQPITSPVHGIVFAQYAKENAAVDPVSSIFTIADMDLLGGIFHVYEKDVAWVRPGQQMVVKSIAYPDRNFTAEVVFISPQLDEETHTIQIRAAIHNEEHVLRFGMLLTGRILVSASPETSMAATVPKKLSD